MIVIKDKKQAYNFLLSGKVLVLPSETSYGLSCLANNQEAVNKIFAIKKRGKNKSLLVIAPTIKMAKKYLEWNDLLDKLAKKYWPGALTIISGVKSEVKKNDLAKGVVSEKNTLALRVTDQPILKYLSSKLALPLVSTSANISGIESTHDVDEVIEAFGKRQEQPDAVFDYGRLLICRPTTVASVINGKVEILRQGEVHLSMCIS